MCYSIQSKFSRSYSCWCQHQPLSICSLLHDNITSYPKSTLYNRDPENKTQMLRVYFYQHLWQRISSQISALTYSSILSLCEQNKEYWWPRKRYSKILQHRKWCDYKESKKLQMERSNDFQAKFVVKQQLIPRIFNGSLKLLFCSVLIWVTKVPTNLLVFCVSHSNTIRDLQYIQIFLEYTVVQTI